MEILTNLRKNYDILNPPVINVDNKLDLKSVTIEPKISITRVNNFIEAVAMPRVVKDLILVLVK